MTVKVTDQSLSQEALWGAKAIAAFMGCSVDDVYRWERHAAVPVCRRGGKYFALKSELWGWLRDGDKAVQEKLHDERAARKRPGRGSKLSKKAS